MKWIYFIGIASMMVAGSAGAQTPPPCGMMMRANAFLIRATAPCHKDYMDAPGGKYVFAMAKTCIQVVGSTKLLSFGRAAMEEFDKEAREQGLASACKAADAMEFFGEQLWESDNGPAR